ncbi:MAG: M28 family peptidase [Candidatus Neomarinimicrobiota bacterium]
MNKKGLVTGIILLFIVSSISPIVLSNTIKISNTELNIKNTSEPLLKNKIYGKKSLNQTIDVDYIYEIANELSNVINNPLVYDDKDLKKGRAFGTKGEQYAATHIVESEMNKLNLWNVMCDPIENLPWPNNKMAHKLEVLSKEMLVNGIPVDCYISPRWNNSHTEHSLFDPPTHNFSHVNLTVKNRLFDFTGFYNKMLADNFNTLTYEIEETRDVKDFETYCTYTEQLFEDTYDIIIEELNTTIAEEKLPWFNSETTSYYAGQPFVLFDADPSFNPLMPLPRHLQNAIDQGRLHPLDMKPLWYYRGKIQIQLKIWYHLSKNSEDIDCKGIILYEEWNDDVYDMFQTSNFALPILSVNKSVGETIINCSDEYGNFDINITYHINQSYNENVESYNVIGQINGTDPSKTIIISSFYDSWWNQGTADSAICVGMLLALAKYYKELEVNHSISPKYTLKFIAFGGEEYFFRGARHYVKKYFDKSQGEDIVTVIDLNQLGFSTEERDPQLTLHLVTNNEDSLETLELIAGETNYEERINDGTKFMIGYLKNGGPSDTYWFNEASILPPFNSCETVLFLKDTGWTLHHRDGKNHSKGDVMDYFYPKDVNLTAEMILNVSKYYILDPDSWFNHEIAVYYEAIGSSNDKDIINGPIKATTALQTSLLQDIVINKAILNTKKTNCLIQSSNYLKLNTNS